MSRTPSLRSGFIGEMVLELRRAEANHAKMNSLHEAYSVILEEVDELWDECRKKRSERNPADVRTELLQIATMAWRAARDLGLEENPSGDREVEANVYSQQECRFNYCPHPDNCRANGGCLNPQVEDASSE